MSRGQIFTLNLWPSNGSRTRACNVRKMSRMYNTEGTPGEFYQLASIVMRQIIYYLYMSKLIYPTWKILDKVYYCQTKGVEDKYKFLLSQFAQWCSIVCSVKNPFNEVTSTSEEKLSSPCHNQRFDTLSTNLGTSLGFDHNNEKNVRFLTLSTFILWKIILLEGECRLAWCVFDTPWYLLIHAALADENNRVKPHEILVKCFKNFVHPWFACRKKKANSERYFQTFYSLVNLWTAL